MLKDGFESYAKDFQVQAGQKQTIDVSLNKLKGTEQKVEGSSRQTADLGNPPLAQGVPSNVRLRSQTPAVSNPQLTQGVPTQESAASGSGTDNVQGAIPFSDQSSTDAGKGSGEPAYFNKNGDSLILGNRFLEMRFSAQNGKLQSLIHKKSGVDLILEKVNSWASVWGIGIYTKDKKRHWTDNNRSSEFFKIKSARVERKNNELKLHLYWDAIRLDNGPLHNGPSYPAQVHATISVYDNSPFSVWGISIQNHGQHAIEILSFPFIDGVKELGKNGSDDCLIVPILEGRLYHDPTRNLKYAGNSYPSCFLNMQFAAYYDTNSGFYLACYDNQGNIKDFKYDKHGMSWASMSFEHRPGELQFGANFTLSYPVTVGVFEGDWYTAADIYKQWAAKQSWAKQTLKNRNLPAWLTDCGVGSCFVTKADFKKEDSSFEDIRHLALDHQRYAGTGLLTELWGWENKGIWSWGDYFPPLEGWASFDELVADFHANHCRLCTYIRDSSLNKNTDFWKSQQPLPFAKRNESGSLLEGHGDPTLPTVEMCPATAFWQEHLNQTAVELAKHKVDLIQFDGFPLPPLNVPCYATNHGHPPGVGKWNTDAWLKILGTTLAACRDINPDVCFTSEGVAEIYIPYLDVAHYWRGVFSEVDLKEANCLRGPLKLFLFFTMYITIISSAKDNITLDWLALIQNIIACVWAECWFGEKSPCKTLG